MVRAKRSLSFWTALFALVLLPAVLLANKQLYQAKITNEAGSGVGSSIITIRQTQGYEFLARTHALGGNQVTQVWLAPADNAWQIPLCTNGGAVDDDCTYDATGNLDLDGGITPSMLMAAGVTGLQFNNALKGISSPLNIVLWNGSAVVGSGAYVRII